jgi:hypothetical protein
VGKLTAFIGELKKEPANKVEKIPLEQISTYLSELQNDQLEIPGQYPEVKKMAENSNF